MRTSLKVGIVAAFAFVASATGAQAALTLPTMQCSYSFSSDMGLGARSTSVMDLQKVLNMYPETRVAVTGAGSAGMETSYFGPATRAAVKKFQAVNNVLTTGFVGPLTRATLNQVCGGATVGLPAGCTSTAGFSPVNGVSCASGTGTVVLPAGCTTSAGFSPTTGQSCATGSTTGGPVTTGPITVVAASAQPNTILVAGQSAANLGEFVFTGNGTITSLELKRLGVSSNDTIVNAYLYEGATRLTDASSVLTNGTVKFNNPLVIAGSRTLSIRGDIKTGTGGQVVGVAISGITVSGGTAMPVLGVNSGLQTIANATMATGNFTTAVPLPGNIQINAGSMNQSIWSNTLSVGTRSVMLKSFTVKMIGSAPANTLANVGLFVNGTKVSSATIDANNRFVFNMMSAPVTLTTGSQLIEVRGDVVAGSDRNFYIVLEQATDILLEDSQLPGAFLTTTINPGAGQLVNAKAGVVDVKGGSLTISQDTTFNNVTTVVGGSTNTKLASFKVSAYGEDVKVNTLTFMPNFVGLDGGSLALANVGLYINGGQVASAQTATHNVLLTFTNLGSNLIATAGTPVIIEIRGDVMTPANVNHTTGTVQFNLQVGSNNAQGVQSSKLSNSPASGGQTLTVSTSNLTASNTVGFAASTKAPNAQQVKIGSFTVQAASAEGVTITNIDVSLAGTLLGANQITNITVKDGSTVVGTPIGSPTTNNNFSANVVVPPSSTKVLEVFADLGSNAAGLTVTPSMTVTARGSTSNVTTTLAAAVGVQTTANVSTVIAGGVTFVPASSPVAQYVIGGNSSLGIATFNVKTNNNVAGAVLRDITFTVLANTISSVTVNGKTANVVGTTAIVYDANITVPADPSGINVPVTVSLVCASLGGGCSGTSNADVNLTVSNVTYNNGSAVVSIAPTAASATHKLVASKPTITMNQVPNETGFGNGLVRIGSFTIAADAAGDIKLEQIPVNISIAGTGVITAGSVQLRDASGSNPPIVGALGVNGNAGLNGSGNLDFNVSDRTIAKGTSETYTVYADFTLVSGTAGTQSVTFKLGDKADFLWTDVAGNATGLTGTPINAYPTNSQTRTN